MEISIVTPAYNEKASVRPLYQGLKKMLDGNRTLISRYEIIYVDDGSTDGTSEEIRNIPDPSVRLISLPQHAGKSAALIEGFEIAAFNIIATIDSDLQDDPFDLPKLITKLEDGYDCV